VEAQETNETRGGRSIFFSAISQQKQSIHVHHMTKVWGFFLFLFLFFCFVFLFFCLLLVLRDLTKRELQQTLPFLSKKERKTILAWAQQARGGYLQPEEEEDHFDDIATYYRMGHGCVPGTHTQSSRADKGCTFECVGCFYLFIYTWK
jgi:hypothetical protein